MAINEENHFSLLITNDLTSPYDSDMSKTLRGYCRYYQSANMVSSTIRQLESARFCESINSFVAIKKNLKL